MMGAGEMPVQCPDPDELWQPASSLPQSPDQEAATLSGEEKTPLVARQAQLPPSPARIEQVQA